MYNIRELAHLVHICRYHDVVTLAWCLVLRASPVEPRAGALEVMSLEVERPGSHLNVNEALFERAQTA